jgi:pilus assembly protein Flp/PilA
VGTFLRVHPSHVAAGRDAAVEQCNRREELGASAVEYGLIVFAIAGLIAVTVFMFGDVVVGSFTDSCDTIHTKAAPSSSCV